MVNIGSIFKKKGVSLDLPTKKEPEKDKKIGKSRGSKSKNGKPRGKGGRALLGGLNIFSMVGLKTVNQLIGIDIGTTSIKLCLLKDTKDGFVLQDFAKRSYDEPLLNDGNIIDQDLVAEELKGLLLENKISCKDAACALSSYTAIIKKVQAPFLKEEELGETIKTEAEAVIPFSLNDIYYSYYIMGVDEERSDMMNVQIVAVKKEIVDNFMDVFQGAGLRLHILDVDVFGVANLVEQIYDTTESSAVAVDIGASITNIAIIKGDKLEFTRELLMGGTYLTGLIEKSTRLAYKEAEGKKLAADPEISYLFEDFIFNISSEITKTINFYMATKPMENISKIYLTGGSSLLPGLKERIGLDTNLEVEYIDPFKSLNNNEIERLAISEDEKVFAAIALYLSSRVRDITL